MKSARARLLCIEGLRIAISASQCGRISSDLSNVRPRTSARAAYQCRHDRQQYLRSSFQDVRSRARHRPALPANFLVVLVRVLALVIDTCDSTDSITITRTSTASLSTIINWQAKLAGT